MGGPPIHPPHRPAGDSRGPRPGEPGSPAARRPGGPGHQWFPRRGPARELWIRSVGAKGANRCRKCVKRIQCPEDQDLGVRGRVSCGAEGLGQARGCGLVATLDDMYIPAHFAANDLAKIAAFVDGAGAADLVTFDGTRLVSTLLPVIWDRDGGANGRLLGHIALNNPQWKTAAAGV